MFFWISLRVQHKVELNESQKVEDRDLTSSASEVG